MCCKSGPPRLYGLQCEASIFPCQVHVLSQIGSKHCYYNNPNTWTEQKIKNNVDPGQTAMQQSDQDLHCLSFKYYFLRQMSK